MRKNGVLSYLHGAPTGRPLGSTVLTTNGSGAFTATGQIPAPQSGSCGSLYDFDNDGDLDLGLADELEDVVLLLRNGPAVLPLFANGFENP